MSVLWSCRRGFWRAECYIGLRTCTLRGVDGRLQGGRDTSKSRVKREFVHRLLASTSEHRESYTFGKKTHQVLENLMESLSHNVESMPFLPEVEKIQKNAALCSPHLRHAPQAQAQYLSAGNYLPS